MQTGFAAVRVGIVIFTIPFVFAWYPELLLIEEAVTITDDTGRRALIDGYSGQIDYGGLMFLGLRLVLALYLLASALAAYDIGPLSRLERILRLSVAVLVMWKGAMLMWVGLLFALLLIGLHVLFSRRRPDPASA
jgi:TRAP-type uncharacterized transport system fused permease subunit